MVTAGAVTRETAFSGEMSPATTLARTSASVSSVSRSPSGTRMAEMRFAVISSAAWRIVVNGSHDWSGRVRRSATRRVANSGRPCTTWPVRVRRSLKVRATKPAPAGRPKSDRATSPGMT